MRKESGPVRELTLELQEADELFAGRGPNVACGSPPLPPGIEQIHEELDAKSLPAALATVIVLPRAQLKPYLAGDIGRAVERYCDMGIRRAEDELRMLRREGIRTLLIGLFLFLIFVSIAEAIVHTGLPSPVRNFLGEDGLFIVVGWVGLWYPIETLLYSPRPYRREKAILQTMRDMQIEIRPADLPAPQAFTPFGCLLLRSLSFCAGYVAYVPTEGSKGLSSEVKVGDRGVAGGARETGGTVVARGGGGPGWWRPGAVVAGGGGGPGRWGWWVRWGLGSGICCGT
jgi:hypothetical protein